MAIELTLRDRHRATAAEHALLALLSLDDVWSEYLAGARTISGDNANALGELVDDMRALLHRLRDDGRFLDEFFVAYASQINDAFERSLANFSFDAKQKLQRVIEGGDVARYARGNLDTFVSGIAEEEAALDEKIRKIRRGEFTPGDLRRRCAVAACLAGVAFGLGHTPAGLSILGMMAMGGCFG